jgi:hypothetical protein
MIRNRTMRRETEFNGSSIQVRNTTGPQQVRSCFKLSVSEIVQVRHNRHKFTIRSFKLTSVIYCNSGSFSDPLLESTWCTHWYFIYINMSMSLIRSRDSAVGIATGYGLDDQRVGVRVPVGSRIVSSPRRPDRLWGPPNLSNGYRGSVPGGKAAGA